VLCSGPPPHPDTILMGSSSVMIGGLPAALTNGNTALGGIIGMGVPTVMIGQ